MRFCKRGLGGRWCSSDWQRRVAPLGAHSVSCLRRAWPGVTGQVFAPSPVTVKRGLSGGCEHAYFAGSGECEHLVIRCGGGFEVALPSIEGLAS